MRTTQMKMGSKAAPAKGRWKEKEEKQCISLVKTIFAPGKPRQGDAPV